VAVRRRTRGPSAQGAREGRAGRVQAQSERPPPAAAAPARALGGQCVHVEQLRGVEHKDAVGRCDGAPPRCAAATSVAKRYRELHLRRRRRVLSGERLPPARRTSSTVRSTERREASYSVARPLSSSNAPNADCSRAEGTGPRTPLERERDFADRDVGVSAKAWRSASIWNSSNWRGRCDGGLAGDTRSAAPTPQRVGFGPPAWPRCVSCVRCS